MPKVQVNHYYCGHSPGEIVEVSTTEAKRLVDTRGGKIVEEKRVEAATDQRAETSENRGGLDKTSAKAATKSEKR